MTKESYPTAWKEAFDEFDWSLEPSEPPEGETGTWHQLFARFGHKGFARFLAKVDVEESVRLALHAALPEEGVLARLLGELGETLEEHGATEPVSTTEGPQGFLRVRYAPEVGRDAIQASLAWMMSASDYIAKFDEDEDPDWPFSSSQASPESEPSSPTPTSSSHESESAPSGFETIGSTAQETGEETSDDDQAEETSSPQTSPFESIGAPEPAPTTGEAASSSQGAWKLLSYETSPARGVVRLRLFFNHPVRSSSQGSLIAALRRSFLIRFDVDVTQDHDASTGERELAVVLTPEAISIEPDPQGLAKDVGSYLSRQVELGDLGVDFLGSIGARSISVGRDRAESKESPRRERTEGESARQVERPRPMAREEQRDEGPGEPVVFDMSEPGGSSGSPLESGNFMDPRLDQPDATTPLIDVVLRHPGYSDRRIGQVLSILLSIDYSQALRIAEEAPCVIARGIGRDRAQTFKNVIEGAGGKILLAEPDAFGTE